jgi:hypothetical protein
MLEDLVEASVVFFKVRADWCERFLQQEAHLVSKWRNSAANELVDCLQVFHRVP